MKSFLSFSCTAMLRLILAILVGCFLLTAVYCIPNSAIQENIISSAETLVQEDAYPNAFTWCQSELDNFTDGIMLSEACCDSEGTALQRAMLSNRDILQNGWLGIYHFVDGRPVANIESYARYWHGYLVTLKPLLLLTDYSGIRIINLIVQSILVVFICCLMYRKGLKNYLLPYLISICIISPLVIAKSLQMSTCYYIFNSGCLAILLIKEKADFKNYMFLFLWIGIATAYFDFLTYPIATFGMPAVFFLLCCKSKDHKGMLLRLFNLLCCWGIGYVGMWVSKWILAYLITGTNVISDAASEAGIWMDEAKQNYTLLYTWYRNIRSFVLNPAFIIALVICIVLFIFYIKRYSIRQLLSKAVLLNALPFIIIAILPFIWYTAMIAHSYVHDFFTSKALVVTAFSIMCALSKVALPDE